MRLLGTERPAGNLPDLLPSSVIRFSFQPLFGVAKNPGHSRIRVERDLSRRVRDRNKCRRPKKRDEEECSYPQRALLRYDVDDDCPVVETLFRQPVLEWCAPDVFTKAVGIELH